MSCYLALMLPVAIFYPPHVYSKHSCLLVSRCAVITEFARDLLARRGVKVVVPGEKERVVVSLSEETNEADVQNEEKNGAEEPKVTATVGEKCEVCEIDF